MKTKKRSLILIAASALFLILLCVGTILTPDVSFSENEKRYLQQKPNFTMTDVLSGRFEEQSEKYLNDQIVGRNLWVKAMAMTEAGLGISDINGVYLCTGGRAVKRVTEADFDWEQYKKNLKQAAALKAVCEEKGIGFYAMLIPTAAYVYEDELPNNAMRFDEDRAFAEAKDALGVRLIDLREELRTAAKDGSAARESADGGVFFRTDHHWSGYGAYLGYAGFLRARAEASLSDKASGGVMIPAAPYAELAPAVLSDDFYGTLYSKVLLDTLSADTIETPSAALNRNCRVKFSGKTYDSLYFKEYLKKKDKYAVYFGGNYDKVDIATCRDTKCGVKDKILIIKDSFANSFVPYLMDDYDEITMIDTRYYRGNVTELAQDYNEVLVLYGIDNFAGEKMKLSGGSLLQ